MAQFRIILVSSFIKCRYVLIARLHISTEIIINANVNIYNVCMYKSICNYIYIIYVCINLYVIIYILYVCINLYVIIYIIYVCINLYVIICIHKISSKMFIYFFFVWVFEDVLCKIEWKFVGKNKKYNVERFLNLLIYIYIYKQIFKSWDP